MPINDTPEIATAAVDAHGTAWVRHLEHNLLQDKPVAVYPHPYRGLPDVIRTDNEAHLWFIDARMERVGRYSEESTFDADGTPLFGYVGDPSPLQAVSGFLMRPATYPVHRKLSTEAVDRLATADELRASRIADHVLTDEEQAARPNMYCFAYPTQRRLLDFTADAMFRTWVPGYCYFNVESSTGYWQFTHERVVKQHNIDVIPEHIARGARAGSGSLADKVGYRRWLKEQGGGFVATKATRSQGERVDKPREVVTYAGVTVPADKSMGPMWRAPAMDITRKARAKAGRRRQRHANAASAVADAPQNPLMKGFSRGAMKRFGFTWLIKHLADLDLKVGPYAWGELADAKQFDSQASAAWGKRINGRLVRRLRGPLKDYVAHSRECWDGPAFVRIDYDKPAGKRHYRMTSDPDFQVGDEWPGFLSGLVVNPIFNKVLGTAALLCVCELALRAYRWTLETGGAAEAAMAHFAGLILRQEYHDDGSGLTDEEAELLLMGRHPLLAVMNIGDDSVILGGRAGEPTWPLSPLRLLVRWAMSVFPNFVWERDPKGKFAGCNLTRDGGRLRWQPNLCSDDQNIMEPEYGVDDEEKRPQPYSGFFTREMSYYFFHPRAKEHFDQREEDWRDAWAFTSLTNLMASAAGAHEAWKAEIAKRRQVYDVVQAAVNFDGHHYGRYDLDALFEQQPVLVGKHFIVVPPDSPALADFNPANFEPGVYQVEADQAWVAPPFEPPPCDILQELR